MLLVLTVLAVGLGVTGLASADSLAGVWKLESGQWPGDGEPVVFPTGAESEADAQSFRVFTGQHQFFISSYPAREIFNANMTRYEVAGDQLTMHKVVVRNAGHLDEWTWTFTLDGDRLTLEMEDMREVWTRVE
jgi:hypothetical protein